MSLNKHIFYLGLFIKDRHNFYMLKIILNVLYKTFTYLNFLNYKKKEFSHLKLYRHVKNDSLIVGASLS